MLKKVRPAADFPYFLKPELQIFARLARVFYLRAKSFIMVKSFLLVLASLLLAPLYAQEQKIDSLKQVIATSNDVNAKAAAYKALVQQLKPDTLLFKEYYKEGLAFARQNSDRETELKLAFINCRDLYDQGKYKAAIAVSDSLHPFFEEEGLLDLKARLFNIAGNSYALQSDYTKASVKYLEYLETAKRLEDEPSAIAMANNNVGMALLNMKRYEQAIPYIENSLTYQQKFDSQLKARALWNLGICQMELLMYDEALQTFKKGVVEANKVDDAYGAAGNQTCIASVLSRKRDFDRGIPAYIKAYEMSVDAGLEYFKIIEALSGVIWGYNMSNQPEKAVKYITIVDSIIETNNMPDIRNREYLFFKSTNLMLRGKPLEADPYFLRYEKALDSMYNVKNIEVIQQKETEFRTKEKEQQLELKEAELSSQRLITSLLAGGAFLLVFIGFLVYRQQRLKIKQQRQEQELKEALATVETKNKLEEQRLRISKELHDNIGSQLTYLASAAQNIGMGLNKTSEAVTQQKLDDLSTFSEEAIRDLRDTIWVMNHSSVTWDDLAERIRYLAHKVANTTGIAVLVHKKGENSSSLDPSQTMHVFRIIQEAVNNAVKHSEATKIEVYVYAENPAKIEIVDNGKGYELKDISESSSGLTNMKARADDLNGKITLESDKNGSKVMLELPSH